MSARHEYFAEHCMATLFPIESHRFDARKDAEALRDAMKNTWVLGVGVDKDVIVDILGSRGCVQRLAIAEMFKTMYGKDLEEAFDSNLIGDFKKVAIALITPLGDFYAKELHWAVKGAGTSEQTLIEILCTLSNTGIRLTSESYEKLFKRKLVDDLKDDTSFYFKRILVSLCQANRDESRTVDMNLVEKDAKDLYEAGVARAGTDETVFNAVMVSRSYPHLKEVFKVYSRNTGHDIVDAIKTEFSGDIKNAHLAIVRSVRCKAEFYAEKLHWSMKGQGTDDRTLIRIIVGRSEIDLGDIKKKFEEMYEGTLESWIKDDTSSHYRNVLLKLSGCA